MKGLLRKGGAAEGTTPFLVNKRVVRILLECFLVKYFICKMGTLHETSGGNVDQWKTQ